MWIIAVVLLIIAMLLWVVFRRDLQDQKKIATNDFIQQMTTSRKKDTLFDQGLQKLHIQQPKFQEMRQEMRKHIVGLDAFIHSLFVWLLVPWGHILVEWVPWLAKTKTISTLSKVLDLEFKRIQFTPDMLPWDILWVDVFSRDKKEFTFMEGPIFSQVILADEINRTTPKVQSALLEAMEEKQVTIGHVSYPLPLPFFVLATQNPLEQEGTYPLPEAQVDRFFMKVLLSYPNHQDEELMLQLIEHDLKQPQALLSTSELTQLQQSVAQVTISNEVKSYIVRCVDATRSSPLLSYGASPRASLFLMYGAKAVAWLQWRNYVMHTDVQMIALPVIRHRVVLQYTAISQWLLVDDVLVNILKKITLQWSSSSDIS